MHGLQLCTATATLISKNDKFLTLVVARRALHPIFVHEEHERAIPIFYRGESRPSRSVDVADVFNQITIYQDRLQPSHLAAALHRIARYFRQRNSNIGTMRDAPRWLALLREVENKIEAFD